MFKCAAAAVAATSYRHRNAQEKHVITMSATACNKHTEKLCVCVKE